MTFEMRGPCAACGDVDGYIEPLNGQDRVFCQGCRRWQYNAPKVETGRAIRSVTTVHNGIKPKQRARILLRANAVCELCHQPQPLHVGHLVSVDDGLAASLTEAELNHDENLAAMCEECNLGLGAVSVTARLLLSMLVRRRVTSGVPV